MSKYLKSSLNLKNQLFLITGANRGVGLVTTKLLSALGANVVMACRDVKAAQHAINSDILPFQKSNLGTREAGQVSAFKLDMSDSASIKAFLAEFKNQHREIPRAVIHNAGVLVQDKRETVDKQELTWQVNYLAPSALTVGLLKQVATMSDAKDFDKLRFVHVGAALHLAGKLPVHVRQGTSSSNDPLTHDAWSAYKSSKLALIASSAHLNNCLQYSDALTRLGVESSKQLPFQLQVDSISVDPGWMKTDLVRSDNGFTEAEVGKNMKGASDDLIEGAARNVLEALLPDPTTGDTLPGGVFVMRGKPARVHDDVKNAVIREHLWKYTNDWIKSIGI